MLYEVITVLLDVFTDVRYAGNQLCVVPDTPMRPRLADDRLGYFTAWRFDYTNDNALTPRVNYIQRWRLEKKDPAAALSVV